MVYVVVDNSQSKQAKFTPKLIKYMKALGETRVVRTLRGARQVQWSKVTHVVLSGGPLILSSCTETEQWSMNLFILSTFKGPVLGICFGMQVMCMQYGGELRRLEELQKGYKPVRGETWLSSHDEYMYAYNDVVSRLPAGFEVVARQGKYITAMMNKDLRRYATQFHPEYSDPKLFADFIAL